MLNMPAFFSLQHCMKKTRLTILLVVFIFSIGNNAVRKTDNYPINGYQLAENFIDTIPGEESQPTKDIYFSPKVSKRTKSVQAKDYAYGKNNLLSFIFAVLSIFCMVLFVATVPLQLPVLMVILYIGHATFLVLSFLKGLKGLKEKKMNILGLLGIIYSSCFGFSMLIGLAVLAFSLLILLLGG